MAIQSYRDLRVWHTAMALVVEIYRRHYANCQEIDDLPPNGLPLSRRER